MQRFLGLVSGGSRAARMASSNTFFNPRFTSEGDRDRETERETLAETERERERVKVVQIVKGLDHDFLPFHHLWRQEQWNHFFWTIGSVILRYMIPRWHSISSTTQFKRCSVSDLVASSGEVVECNQLNILQPSVIKYRKKDNFQNKEKQLILQAVGTPPHREGNCYSEQNNSAVTNFFETRLLNSLLHMHT